LKDELGIVADSTEDAKLSRIIGRVSRELCGPEGLDREAWRQTYIEKLAGDGGRLMSLSRWPVESITSITYDGATVDASTYDAPTLDRDSNVFRADGWNRNAPTNSARFPETGDRALLYTITYVAGWLMPGEVATASEALLPDDIQDAAIMAALGLYRGRDVEPGVRAEQVEGMSRTYAAEFEAGEIPPASLRVMRAWR